MPLPARTKWNLAKLAVCGTLGWTAPAAACVALPQTYTLDGAYPAPDASNVPTNAPLVLRLVDPPPRAIGDSSLVPTITPLSHAQANEVVQLISMVIGLRGAQVSSFVPAQPLQPHTTYLVDLGVQALAADAAATWQFTTGDALAAALRLKGDLSISYEAGTDPHYDCSAGPSLCGPCTVDKQVNVTKARVELPASFDGFSAQGVQAALRVYEPLPDGKTGATTEIDPPITAGEVGETLITMPLRDDGTAYAPCFQFEVTDAGGVRTSQLQCLDAPFPLPAAATTGAAGAASDIAIDDTADGVPDRHSHTSTACSFALSERGAGTEAWLLGALLLTGWRRRQSLRLTSYAGSGHSSRGSAAHAR
jgi:hypothetical protein